MLGTIGFVKLEGVCQSLRKLQTHLFEKSLTPALSFKESADRDNHISPKYQAQTVTEQSKADIIFTSAVAVQIISAVYIACTTALAVLPLDCIESNLSVANPHRHAEGVASDMRERPSHSLSPFQMGYSLGAHEAFLLALFMLASAFPKCPASVGGALLSSMWRLLIACCSLVSLLSTGLELDLRRGMSLFFTLLEAASMFPILIASLQLTMEAGTFQTILGLGQASAGKSAAAYAPIKGNDLDDEICDKIETGCSISETSGDTSFRRLSVRTLRVIASSSRFSTRQRFGAYIMWISSCCLLVGMTMENVMLLITSPVGAHSTHEIYKWGMHLCSMFAFCVIMNVSSIEVYAQTRILLCFACPAGSFIGLWQLWVLINNTPDLCDDPLALLIACLFAWRALSGVGQCIGLFVLNSIETDTGTLEQMDVTTKDSATDEDMLLCDAISRGRFALFMLFLPAFTAYTATSALLSSCSEPMISPTLPVSCGGMSMFMLVPNWPGLGLFFHFGGLLVIFASDGLATSTPSYPPSVVIGSLFALHALMLIAIHILLELMHPNILEYLESFRWQDWLRRITLAGWMVSSFYLYLCLHRVWKLKQPVNF